MGPHGESPGIAESGRDGIYYDERGPTTRAPGRRVEGLYASIPTGYSGTTIDHFLLDPVGDWEGPPPTEPVLVAGNSPGVSDLVAVIDSRAYPFVPDFVEEARRFGLSVRLRRDFDLSRLTPGESGLRLVHPRGFAAFSINRPWRPSCPYGRCRAHLAPDDRCGFHGRVAQMHESRDMAALLCLGNTWTLSALAFAGEAHKPVSLTRRKGGMAECLVTTPTVRYGVEIPETLVGASWDATYEPGVVMRFPTFYLEFISRSRGLPKDLRQGIRSSGLEITVCYE